MESIVDFLATLREQYVNQLTSIDISFHTSDQDEDNTLGHSKLKKLIATIHNTP